MTNLPPRPEPTPAPARRGFFRRLRELTRLVVGGAEIAANTFFDRLQRWEAAAAVDPLAPPAQAGETSQPAPEAAAPPHATPGRAAPQPGAYPAPEHLPVIRPGEEWRLAELVVPDHRADESERDALRLALIGWLFEAEERLESGMDTGARLLDRLARRLDAAAAPLTQNRLARPARRRFTRLAARGEAEVERWIARGRREEARGKRLAQAAYSQTIDEYIEYLARSPELQELVQSQSEGLAGEVVEELRERTVSADAFLEGFARRMMGRAPRRALAEPPPEVRASAVSLRHTKPDP